MTSRAKMLICVSLLSGGKKRKEEKEERIWRRAKWRWRGGRWIAGEPVTAKNSQKVRKLKNIDFVGITHFLVNKSFSMWPTWLRMQTVNSGLPKCIQLAVRVGLKPGTSGVQSQRSNRSATKIIPIIFMAYGRRELEKIIIITKWPVNLRTVVSSTSRTCWVSSLIAFTWSVAKRARYKHAYRTFLYHGWENEV